MDFVIVTDLECTSRSLVTPKKRSGKQVLSIVLYCGQLFLVYSSQIGMEGLFSCHESLLKFLM